MAQEGAPGAALTEIVRAQLKNADELMLRLVTATVGLLAGVAWADGDYPESEQRAVRERLQRIDAFSRRETTAIGTLLARRDVAEASGQDPATWTGELSAVTDLWQRREVLDLLVEVAVADGDLAPAEERYLSAVARGLGLGDEALGESLARPGLA